MVSSPPGKFRIAVALIAAISYLLHIRVIDECRDFEHDNRHHSTRPIQSGTISRKELRKLDGLAVATFAAIAAFLGAYSMALGLIMLGYSYFAGKEFFFGEKIRQHFFIYNGTNIVQMFLMQLFIYIIFAGSIPLTALVATHFVFTSVGTVISEFVRKIKTPGNDGTGKDTYTWYVGFNKAIMVYISLLLLNGSLFFMITTLLTPNTVIWMFFAAGAAIVAILFALAHLVKRSYLTDKLMQLFFLIMYGAFNVAIYFLRSY